MKKLIEQVNRSRTGGGLNRNRGGGLNRNRNNGGSSGGSTGGGNVSQGWLPDPTGNQTWEYQVRDCKWIARKKGKTTEYIISDEPKYASSVQILNGKYPDLLKNCNNSNTQQSPTQTTPVDSTITSTPTTVNLPDWVDCIKTIKTIKVTQDGSQEEIVFTPFGEDKGYFWKDKTFVYVYKNGNKTYGKWSCKNNGLVIVLIIVNQLC
jgi:hypothetical protein